MTMDNSKSTDFDFASKCASTVLMPVFCIKLALYTLALSSRRFASERSFDAKRESVEIVYSNKLAVLSPFALPLHSAFTLPLRAAAASTNRIRYFY